MVSRIDLDRHFQGRVGWNRKDRNTRTPLGLGLVPVQVPVLVSVSPLGVQGWHSRPDTPLKWGNLGELDYKSSLREKHDPSELVILRRRTKQRNNCIIEFCVSGTRCCQTSIVKCVEEIKGVIGRLYALGDIKQRFNFRDRFGRSKLNSIEKIMLLEMEPPNGWPFCWKQSYSIKWYKF